MTDVLYQYANLAATTVASPINASATSVTLASGTGVLFPVLGTNEYFWGTFKDAATGLITEVVLVTAVSTDTFTIVRAQQGTSAVSWAIGDKFSQLNTASDMSNMYQLSSINAPQVDFSLQALNPGASYTGTATASFTPLTNGWFFCHGKHNLSAVAAANITGNLEINVGAGNISLSTDSTELSQSHFGAGYALAGSSVTVTYKVTTTTDPTITMTYAVGAFFLPTA